MSSFYRQLTPPSALTLGQIAVDELQDAILSGRLPAGAPLRLEETSRALGMSPSPVREALRELGRLGLVVQIPHKGAHVAELSAEDLRDTYDVRLVLETKAVWLAAERFGPADEAAAETHLAAYDKALWASAMRDARASHSGFHFALYSAAGSPWLLRLIRPVWENSERYRFMTAASAEALRERDREHRQILEACIEHDADRASALLHDHLSSTVAHVAKHMGAA